MASRSAAPRNQAVRSSEACSPLPGARSAGAAPTASMRHHHPISQRKIPSILRRRVSASFGGGKWPHAPSGNC